MRGVRWVTYVPLMLCLWFSLRNCFLLSFSFCKNDFHCSKLLSFESNQCLSQLPPSWSINSFHSVYTKYLNTISSNHPILEFFIYAYFIWLHFLETCEKWNNSLKGKTPFWVWWAHVCMYLILDKCSFEVYFVFQKE